MSELKITVPRYEQGAVGLPDHAVAFSNSERGNATCDHRYWLRHIEGLVSTLDRPPLRYGRAWHLFTEDLHRWWMQFDSAYPDGAEKNCAWCAGTGQVAVDDCDACDGTGHGPVMRAWQAWQELERNGILEEGTADDDARRLNRAVDGYMRLYGRGPMDSYKVVAVELSIAAPIINPRTKAPYCPVTWVTPLEGGGWRLARTGEANGPDARKVRWPWFQVMQLDAVYANRDDPSKVWVYEGKSSKDPERRMHDLLFETQVPGYTWGLRNIAKKGLLPWLPTDARVVGYVFDVAASKLQRDPALKKPAKVKVLDLNGEPVMNGKRYTYELDGNGEPILRSPGFSTAHGGPAMSVPSWRFLDAVRREGFAEAEYQDHMFHLMDRVDPKLYVRDYPTCGHEVTTRYAHEIHSVARKLAGLRRAAATATTRGQIYQRFPRTPICTMPGGTCPLRGPCLQDGEIVRRDYVTAPTVEWQPVADTSKQKDLDW